MAVTKNLSQLIANWEAVPRVLNNGYVAGANDTTAMGVVTALTTDSVNSTYLICPLPSGVRIGDIQKKNTAAGATGAFKLGVLTNDFQGLILNAGSSPALQTWSSTVAYVPGNVVVFNGVVYYCTTGNTGSQPPSGNWTTGGSQVAPTGSVPIPNSDLIFGSGVAITAVQTTWQSIYTPTVGAVAYTPTNENLRVWELMGMINDPEYMFILTATLTTVVAANTTIAFQLNWLR